MYAVFIRWTVTQLSVLQDEDKRVRWPMLRNLSIVISKVFWIAMRSVRVADSVQLNTTVHWDVEGS